MNKRILKIVGGLVIVMVVLGLAALGGSMVYAAARTMSDFAVARVGRVVRGPLLEKASQEAGIVIAEVVADGPAAKAGVARGDILLEIDEQSVNRPADLARYLAGLEAGDQTTLTVRHGDVERTLALTLGERDDKPYLGLTLCGGSGQVMAMAVEAPGIVLSKILTDGPADKAGLKAGDVITAIDGKDVGDETNLADLITSYKPGDTVTLRIDRPGEEQRDVTVELGENPQKGGTAYLGVEFLPLPHFDLFDGERPSVQPHFEGRRLGGIKIERGAVVREVTEGSPAATAGLQAGDAITAIDGEAVQGVQVLIEAIAGHKPGDKVTLTVYRQDAEQAGEEIEIEITLGENPDKPGAAYLGVSIGAFFHMQRMDDGSLPAEPGEFFKRLPDHLELPAVPDHLELPGNSCCDNAF